MRDPGSVRRYLDAIATEPLLTAAAEVDLAKRLEAGLYAAELLRQADAGERSVTGERRADLVVVAGLGRERVRQTEHRGLTSLATSARRRVPLAWTA